MKRKEFPFYKQPDSKDCGPTCLRIVSKHYGKLIPLQTLRDLSETTREGSSFWGMSNAAEQVGFRTLSVRIDFNTLVADVPLPCIVHWNKQHFVVVYKIEGKKDQTTIHVSDPSFGLIKYNKQEFIKSWIGGQVADDAEEGLALVLETTPVFYQADWDKETNKMSFSFLSKYLIKHKSLIVQLALGLLAGSILSLIFPFLTQSIVDIGIQNQDLNFIHLILIAQLMVFIGRMGIGVIRSWILLHLSARINISILSDFFIKLMRLPVSFFDTRMIGDIMQRISDHNRIEKLLTISSLETIFSLVNLIVFSIVLLLYDYKLFLIYIAGSALYVTWILLFLKKRKELDYKQFSQLSQEQSKMYELINGMQVIKIHNAEKPKRWEWEYLQVKLFKIKIKALSLEQWQSVGGDSINQFKDIFISFFAAKLVLDGQLSLGMMLSVQYIIGQLNGPLMQLVEFIRQSQDAKIALERLGEIHDKEDEEQTGMRYVTDVPEQGIALQNVSFRYTGSKDAVLENLDLTIPYQKTTAIVGASGSGKTTLLKLLMKFYEPTEGEIKIGHCDLKHISPTAWREKFGAVLQEGYTFNDTVANNIAIGEEYIDKERLKKAVEIANIKTFIEGLPLSYNTQIGHEGLGMSGGQTQRLMIARAVYKSPEYILFDEATSALDANNEKVIIENLNQFFKGKTAVVIAHRLSTVKHADKIVVLDRGKIVEEGTHSQLVELKGEYYRLVKNQLELGN